VLSVGGSILDFKMGGFQVNRWNKSPSSKSYPDILFLAIKENSSITLVLTIKSVGAKRTVQGIYSNTAQRIHAEWRGRGVRIRTNAMRYTLT
jgi:hypothetical protein